MDVSRITSGKIELRRERMDLRAAIAAAVESIQSAVDANAQQLIVTLPDEPMVVDGDAARLTQVFGNILHNALKFTPREGTITLVAKTRDDQAVVTISDNGLGIPEQMLAEIFETFRQVDSSLERVHGGLGIGLMLVKRITELHAGTVEAYSGGAGAGSRFVVNLPLLSRQEADEEKPLAPPTTEMPPGHRILVVDDIPEVAESLAALLEVIGQEVFVAHDGHSALELALARRPDIVFLDIAMPGMNGYDAAREMRAQVELQDVTLVALTGHGQAEDRQRAAEAGFTHHLTKPTGLAKLRELLSQAPVAT
jgi:CheY-like chemotaxis protein/two-component sensor histidine kinase